METTLKYISLLCLAVVFSGCIKDYDDDYKRTKSLYGKWEVTKYEFTYFEKEFGWVTDVEFPYSEGYREEYTFKKDGVYYYLYEDEREMELYKGFFEYRRTYIWLDDILYDLYIYENTMTLETTYNDYTTKITLESLE